MKTDPVIGICRQGHKNSNIIVFRMLKKLSREMEDTKINK